MQSLHFVGVDTICDGEVYAMGLCLRCIIMTTLAYHCTVRTTVIVQDLALCHRTEILHGFFLYNQTVTAFPNLRGS